MEALSSHDDRLHAYAIERAREGGWQAGEYEFEMLLGVRGDVAEELVRGGKGVRLYLPFGRDWPYALRRIGENPRNAWLLLRSPFDPRPGALSVLLRSSHRPPSDKIALNELLQDQAHRRG